MCTEPKHAAAEDLITNHKLADGRADGIDLSRQLAAKYPPASADVVR
jgi:hypothetical protein